MTWLSFHSIPCIESGHLTGNFGECLLMGHPESLTMSGWRRSVKAQDELPALGLDGRLASHKSPAIQAKESII
jgi:hypothetical protein